MPTTMTIVVDEQGHAKIDVPPVDSVTAAVAVPVEPPSDWFELPGGPDGDAYDVVIEDSGRIHGFPAATWDSCHLSYEQCVTPPRSATDYAYFKVGNVITADGQRVKTGPLTLKGGHADPMLSAAKAMAFYDDTNSAFADVNIGEDHRGIWIAGALRPTATPETIRAAMGSGFSGDWRPIGGNHELIALSAVNTPGFRHRARVYETGGMVASYIFDLPRTGISDTLVVERTTETSTSEVVVELVEDADAVLASAVDRVARSIGRSIDQRIEQQRARVHKEAS